MGGVVSVFGAFSVLRACVLFFFLGVGGLAPGWQDIYWPWLWSAAELLGAAVAAGAFRLLRGEEFAQEGLEKPPWGGGGGVRGGVGFGMFWDPGFPRIDFEGGGGGSVGSRV